MSAIEADWAARSAGANVVWAHDFRYPAELTQFLTSTPDNRYFEGAPIQLTQDGGLTALTYLTLGATSGPILATDTVLNITDPSGLIGSWPTSDFYVLIGKLGTPKKELVHVMSRTGNVLTLEAAAGVRRSIGPTSTLYGSAQDWPSGANVGNANQTRWNRPFAAFAAPGNGKPAGQDDRPPSGRPLRTWYNLSGAYNRPPSDPYYGYGYYGNAAYRSAYPNFTSPYQTFTDAWDGGEFWIQYRVKLSSSWFTTRTESGSNEWGFKQVFIQPMTSAQWQLIVNIDENDLYAPGNSRFVMSTDWASTRIAQANSTWQWVGDEWVTVMVHAIPGTDGAANTTVQAWVCRQSVTPGVWTKVVDTSTATVNYVGGIPPRTQLPGYNAFGPTNYLNMDLGTVPPPTSWKTMFTQAIFSTAEIPCPLA